MNRINRPFAAIIAVVLALGSAVLGSDVSYWTHSSAADYSEATLENLVVTNYGHVQLTRRLETLAEGVEGVSVVYALAQGPDGAIWAGTGPTGVLLRIADGQTQRFVLPEVSNIFSLAFDAGGRLIVGTGGERGRVLRVEVEGEEVRTQTLLEAEDVSYVWRIARHADGALYAATGPGASLYEIRDGGEPRKVFSAGGEKNLLSLALTAGDAIYAGTDPNGLIWQVNRQTGEARVLFDAVEPEITSLAISGNALFATGAARGEMMEEGAEPGPGTPDVLSRASPIDRQPVEMPEEPEFPPTEPDRIPLQDQDPPRREPPELPPPDRQEPPEQEEPEAQPQPIPQPHEHENGFGPAAEQFSGEGSAVYRIDITEGRIAAVTGVTRDAALFLDLVAQNGRLLLAAGALEEGGPSRVLQLDPVTTETALLAEPDARNVVAMLPLSDGRVALGLANPGGVAVLSATYAAEGTLTSPPLDSGALSTYGTIHLAGRLPEGTQLLISTRSGNTQEPETNPDGWSQWSEPQEARRFVPGTAVPGRFFQYRLIFRTDGTSTPSLERVRIAYLQPNLPPQVTAVEVTSELSGQEIADIVNSVLSGASPPSTLRAITWEAADPNDDPLVYDLYIRRGDRGDFQMLVADLAEPSYAWDAAASGDGLYQFRVVARDARGNPRGGGLSGARVSEMIEVDLTPPRIGDLEVAREGAAATVSLRVADAGGTVARLEYLVTGDPADPANWQRAFPEDGMTDSPEERYVIQLDPAPAGAAVRLRAVDDSGNVAYQTVSLPGQ